MKNLYIMIALAFLLALPLAFATQQSLGTFKQSTCINLIQICSNCTYNNISSVNYPDSTQALGQVPMTKTGTLYNYTFCLTSQTGSYIVNGFGDLDGITQAWNYDFSVNPSGQSFDQAKANMYISIFLWCIFIFAALLTLGIMLPGENKTEEMTGFIIAVSNIKYLKLIFLGMAYVFMIFIAYYAWMLSYAFLSFNFLSSIMQWVFYVLVVLALPLFILFLYLTIANLVRDSKIEEALSYGIKTKG